MSNHLVDLSGKLEAEPIRKGFGKGLLEAGKETKVYFSPPAPG